MGFNIKKYLPSSSFLKGMATIFNIAGGIYSRLYWMKENLTPQEQDALAMKEDWESVGNDLRYALNKYKKSLVTKLEN